MATTAPDPGLDRPRLKASLRTDLLEQSLHHDWQTANLDQLRDLEARIQETARKLEPAAPDTAIGAARHQLTRSDLVSRLARRAELPVDPTRAPEPVRVRIEFLEAKLLELARQVEPRSPGEAIAAARGPAAREAASHMDLVYPDPAHHLRTARRQLKDVSQRLQELAAPTPGRRQRISQTLEMFERLEGLNAESRDLARSRSSLMWGGDLHELRLALERAPQPGELLERSAGEIYRDPRQALRALDETARRHGWETTLERFGRSPSAFGKLRGSHLPALGASPERSRALELASDLSGRAAAALVRRGRLETDLGRARSIRRLQDENTALFREYPGRHTLLAELGRRVEGLEIDEVRSLLRPGQERFIVELRRAEQDFLEPLRKVSRHFRALEAAGEPVGPAARTMTALLRNAPRHVLKRLTPPQMQTVLVAAAVARKVGKMAARTMSA